MKERWSEGKEGIVVGSVSGTFFRGHFSVSGMTAGDRCFG
jgi:hypothetical protein